MCYFHLVSSDVITWKKILKALELLLFIHVLLLKVASLLYICWQTILTDIKHTSYFSLCLYPYLSKVIAIHIELHVGKWCQWHHNIEVPVNISTISAGGSDPPFNVPSSRCLHLSDPAGLHLSGTPARRSSLPPQEEETAHPPCPIHSLFCSAVPPLTPGGPEGYFGEHGQHRPRPCHPPLKAHEDKVTYSTCYTPPFQKITLAISQFEKTTTRKVKVFAVCYL